MTQTASSQTCRFAAWHIAALILLVASQVRAQNRSSLPVDSAWGRNEPSPAGSDIDGPPGARGAPGNGQAAVSVDVLRHPIPEKARRMFLHAVDTFKAGDDEAAREQLLETLAKYPNTAAYVHSVLGVIYVKASRYDEAVNSFERAVSLLPHDAMTHYNFGLSLACVMDYNRAEQEARRALELDPKNTSAQTLLDVLLDHKKQTENRDATQPVSLEVSSRSQGPGN